MAVFLGNEILRLDSIDSTNSYAQYLLNYQKTFDGTVVIAKKQFAGRGQRGKTWYSEPNNNLSFSIILKNNGTQVQNQFYLNMAVALGIANYIFNTINSSNEVHIKWPNDILVNEKKIAGILIENTINGDIISNSVVGIGLNVNQQIFNLDSNSREATSLSVCNNTNIDLDVCLSDLLTSIEKFVLLFRNEKFLELSVSYHQLLYKKNIPSKFLFNNSEIIATINQVNKNGQLELITSENEKITCNVQEIKFL